MIKFFISVILLVSNFSAQSWAQEEGAESAKAGAKKKTNIDFEDQLVEGELKKPELFYLLQKKQINFGRLIKLRENFIPELERTAEDLKREGDL